MARQWISQSFPSLCVLRLLPIPPLGCCFNVKSFLQRFSILEKHVLPIGPSSQSITMESHAVGFHFGDFPEVAACVSGPILV